MILNSPSNCFTHELLQTIIDGPKAIETLICAWVRNGKHKLVFGPDEISEDPKANFLILLERDKVQTGIKIDLAIWKKKYKKINSYFEPDIVADTGKTRLQFEEIEKHRKKNGVKWDSEAEHFIMNPSFIGNLCISYLIDNRAIITISKKLLEDEKYRIRDYYIFEIFHMGEISGVEKYAVLEERLERYLGK